MHVLLRWRYHPHVLHEHWHRLLAHHVKERWHAGSGFSWISSRSVKIDTHCSGHIYYCQVQWSTFEPTVGGAAIKYFFVLSMWTILLFHHSLESRCQNICYPGATWSQDWVVYLACWIRTELLQRRLFCEVHIILIKLSYYHRLLAHALLPRNTLQELPLVNWKNYNVARLSLI